MTLDVNSTVEAIADCGERSQSSTVGNPIEPSPLFVAKPLTAEKLARLRDLLKSWREDESGYEEETWPTLKAGLKANRAPGERELFRD